MVAILVGPIKLKSSILPEKPKFFFQQYKQCAKLPNHWNPVYLEMFHSYKYGQERA